MTALKNRKNVEGSALIIAIILASLLFIVSASFLLMTSSEYRLNNRSYRSAVAINLAEAGVDYAIWELAYGNIDSWEGEDPKTKEFNSLQTVDGKTLGDVYVEVFDATQDNPIIESTGYTPDKEASDKLEREVRVKLKPGVAAPFNGVFFGDENVEIAGSCFTDSYDSRLGDYGGENVDSNGDVGTNGTTEGVIDVDGTATVNGDAATGPEGTVTGEENITGTISHDSVIELAPVEVPSELTSLYYWDGFGLLSLTGNSTYTLDPGNYKFKRVKLSGSAVLTINGPANIYITGYIGKSIEQSGSSEIIFNGDVVFYVDDSVELSGSGITNSGKIPSEFMLLGTASCDDIYITGSSAFYGTIYAPSAEIDLAGSADAYGSFVGEEVKCTGGAGYHYDEALKETEVPVAGYSVVYWQEKE